MTKLTEADVGEYSVIQGQKNIFPVEDIVDDIKIKDIILNFVENRIEKDICNA